ncbi:MAG: serine/threonine protein kinase [Anaerolineales bacterium]|nr:serine/threonine protein kinase [Anaerolineales bacterium]
MAASLEGQTLGKYTVLEPLGSGGMARVYRAYHPKLDRYVAIKVLRSDLVDDPMFLSRFRHEAQAVAALRHPNIVQVFDFDIENDDYYMVMELLDGDSLHTRLNDYRVRGEQMPYGEMVRILLDVLDGLDYAHAEGMIHRDIKPANILLTRKGQAVLGTLNYMAPEQGLQGICDARSDIYAMGVVFYEMLTQQPPYEADTPLAILLKHVNDPLPLPHLVNAAIPLSLERVVLKSLAKEPDNRFQSAAEMAQVLRQAAEEADVMLPTRISLPLSFTTERAPAESVAVISGTARGQLANASFAAEETDASLGPKLEAELAALKAAEKRQPTADEDTAVPQNLVWSTSQELTAGRAAGTAAVALISANLIMVMLAGIFNGSYVFHYFWPAELLLVGGGLFYLMKAIRNVWLMIPAGLFSGTAVLMGFTNLLDAWSTWSFLWPLQVFLTMGVIWWAVKWGNQGSISRQKAYRAGQRFSRLSYALVVLIALAALVRG